MNKVMLLQISVWDLVTVIAFVITIVAFFISIYQSYQSQKQTSELKSHTKQLLQNSNDLRDIMGAMSTKFLGPYPDYLDSVITLIEKATKEIKIICSIPTPHIFGDPAMWLKYEQILEKKVFCNINITMITLTESQRRKRLETEFIVAKTDWTSWLTEKKTLVELFLKRYFQDEKIENLDYQRFVTLLLSIQNRKLEEVYNQNGINVIEYDYLLPIHTWIIDNQEAVFSMQTASIGKDNHGFSTSDQGLINALNKMTELYKMNTHPRIDTIIVTKNFEKSIKFYKDIVGLEMRPICNPVAIFKYDYASLYVYNDTFFEEQFSISSDQIVSNGMLSIQINDEITFKQIVAKLNENKADHFELLLELDKKYIIKDFNNFIMEIWYL